MHRQMGTKDPVFVADDRRTTQDDLRQQISSTLLARNAVITADAIGVFPFASDAQLLDTGYCSRIATALVELLAFAVRDGRVDSRGNRVSDLYRLVLERSLSIERLFTFGYLLERTALDELALSDTIGATTEPWPVVAQLVRRASFDVLAAHAERMRQEPTDASIVDKLTTLHTRPVFDAVLGKELERAGRFGTPVSVIFFDVDRLSSINEEHGYGVGDRILERLGITIRKYFRQHDWVARHSEDSIVVLLTRTDAQNATELAESVRATVEERLGFIDYRTDRPVVVTVSAGVVNVEVAAGDLIDPERLMADAERAVDRAKQQGRNRVERIDVRYPYSSS